MQHNDVLSGFYNCIKFVDEDWNYFWKLKKLPREALSSFIHMQALYFLFINEV